MCPFGELAESTCRHHNQSKLVDLIVSGGLRCSAKENRYGDDIQTAAGR